MQIPNPFLELNAMINTRQWVRCDPPASAFNHRDEMCAPWIQDARRVGVTVKVGDNFFIVMRDRQDRITDCWRVR